MGIKQVTINHGECPTKVAGMHYKMTPSNTTVQTKKVEQYGGEAGVVVAGRTHGERADLTVSTSAESSDINGDAALEGLGLRTTVTHPLPAPDTTPPGMMTLSYTTTATPNNDT